MAKVINKNKAFVRYDKNGNLVAGSLTINKSIPKNGDWEEIPSSTDCCIPDNSSIFLLRLIFDNPANAPVANPNDVNDWNTFFNTTSFFNVTITIEGEIQLKTRSTNIVLGTEIFANNTHLIKIIDEGCISSIGFLAFGYCPNLEYVDIPKSTLMAISAFNSCTNLEYVNLPLINYIESQVFKYCSNLNYINIAVNASVINVYGGAFQYANVPSTFPFEKVSYFGDSSFAYATGIGAITLNKLSQLAYSVFQGSSVTSVTIPNTNPNIINFEYSYNCFLDCTSLTSFVFDTIGDTSYTSPQIVGIGSRMFSGCTNLSTLVFKPAIDQIGEYAFYNCSSLTSLYFPYVKAITGTNVFRGCTGVTSIYLPRATQLGSTSVNNNIFLGITGKTIKAVFSNNVLNAGGTGIPDADISYLLANNTVTYTNSVSVIMEFNSLASIASIVPTYNNVASWNTFFDLPANGAVFSAVNVMDPGPSFPQALPTVNLIKSGNIDIKASLFENSSIIYSLDEIFGGGVVINRISLVGNKAFKNSTLKNLCLPYVLTISDEAFRGCQNLNLKYWRIQAGVALLNSASIGNYAFEGAGVANPDSDLVFAGSIGGTTPTLGEYCFANSKLWNGLWITGISTVPKYAFQNCPKIGELRFDGATSVGDGAFAGCTGLYYINIQSCTSLGSTVGDNGVFLGIIGKTIDAQFNPFVLTNNAGGPDGDVVYLTTNNIVT